METATHSDHLVVVAPERALTADQGKEVRRQIALAVRENEPVALSFAGTRRMTSDFLIEALRVMSGPRPRVINVLGLEPAFYPVFHEVVSLLASIQIRDQANLVYQVSPQPTV